MTPSDPIAYLSFDGNCTEAMRFYESVLGGQLFVLTAGASPMADQTPPELRDKVMHASLTLPGGGTLFAGDHWPGTPYEGIKGVALTLNCDTVDEAQRIFERLSAGGTVTMPINEAFWAKAFGMLTDRFGCPWVVNGEMKPMM
jgi:PhnB protein